MSKYNNIEKYIPKILLFALIRNIKERDYNIEKAQKELLYTLRRINQIKPPCNQHKFNDTVHQILVHLANCNNSYTKDKANTHTDYFKTIINNLIKESLIQVFNNQNIIDNFVYERNRFKKTQLLQNNVNSIYEYALTIQDYPWVFLNCAFTWHLSTQGIDYWVNINETFKKIFFTKLLNLKLLQF